MFRLKELKLFNFMSFASATVDFSRRGFWIIKGFNNSGGDSNGAGKSAIISAIVWALFGRTQTGVTTRDLIRWGETGCSAILTIISDEHTYQIVRSSEVIEFFIDGIKQEGHKKDLQTLINNTFGTDFQLFSTFNVFTKTWSRFITEVGDADKKKLFKAVLRMQQLDEASDRAKEIYSNLKVQAGKTEGTIGQLNNSLPELEELLAKNVELAKQDEKQTSEAIRALEQQKESLRPEIEDFSKGIVEIEERIKELSPDKALKELDALNTRLTNIRNVIFSYEASIQESREKLRKADLLGIECPTCGQPILAKTKQVYRRQLELVQKAKEDALKESLDEQDMINEDIYKAEAVLEQLRTLEEEKKSIERLEWEQNLKVKKFEEFCEMADISINKLRTERKDYDRLIEITQAKIDKVKSEIDQYAQLFQTYLKEIDMFNYIVWLYSRQGVVNLIIEKCFNRLKFLANKYLVKVCSEGFKIDISPQKALKSGEFREEIDLFIWNKGRRVPYASLSSGQQQRVNTALLVALYMWGREIGANNFDFVLLDEVLDLSLGVKGQEDIVTFIQELRPTINHIIVITHKELMAGRFDKELQIVRDDREESKIVWN